MIHFRPLALILASALIATPALALDVDAFVQRAEAGFKSMNYEVTFGTASIAGDTVTIDGAELLRFTWNGQSLPIPGPIIFEGVTDRGDGSFSAASMVTGPLDHTYDDHDAITGEPLQVRYLSNGLTLHNLYFPVGEPDFANSLRLYATAELDGWSMQVNEYEQQGAVFLSTQTAFVPDQMAPTLAAVDMAMTIEGGAITLFEGDMLYPLVARRDNDTIVFDFAASQTWDLKAGITQVTDLTLSAPGFGTLSGSHRMSGQTPQVMDQLFGLMEGAERKTLEGDTMGSAMLYKQLFTDLAPAIMLEKLDIRYEDDGLMADYQDDAIKMFASLPAAVAGPDERAAMLALRQFVNEPQSLSLSITKPQNFYEVMSLATRPGDLYGGLGIVAIANDGATAPLKPGEPASAPGKTDRKLVN